MQFGSDAARFGAEIGDRPIASNSDAHAEGRRLKRIASNRFGQTLLHCIAALCLLALSVVAHAQTTADASLVQVDSNASAMLAMPVCGKRAAGDTRPRIGLALGGGGARGIAHISVLREIEALHIPIDCVAGTSMGSLVGGLFASGMSVDALEHLVLSTDWDRLFDDTLERPERSFRRKQDDRDRLATIGVGLSAHGLKVSPGMLQGEKILALLERSTLPVSMIVDFNELPIPFRAIATDLNTGAAVVLDHGSLALSMRASMSLPGIFSPVEIDGRSLLDGGLADQVPIDVVRAMGADIVIAVDVGTPLARLDSSSSMLEVVSQLTGMMTTGNTRRQLATLTDRDVLIVPELGDHVTTSDFGKGSEALAIGAQAATAKRGELERLSVPESIYLASNAQPVLSADGVMVEFVRLDNTTRYADAFLLEQLHIKVDAPLDVDELEKRLLRIYSLGTVSTATYEVAQEDGRGGVVVHVTPKSQGPNYVQIGLSLDSDFAGTHNSALRAALLISPVSAYGAEARFSVDIGSEPALKAEYYHPFDLANRYLSYSRLGYRNLAINAYDDNGHNVATYDVNALEAEVRLAREFANLGALSVGYLRATGNSKVQIGDPDLPRFDFNSAIVDVRGVVDRLDSLYFPRDGYYASLGYSISRESLGADSDYDQVNFDALTAKSIGRNSVQFGVAYHSTLSGTLPIQARYRLGGLGRLVGFGINELTGQQYSYVVLGYTYQLAEIFGRSALIGTTFEYGNAWERREDMKLSDGIPNGSLYAGFDSWLGPLSFGYGFRQGGEGVLFLELGKPF